MSAREVGGCSRQGTLSEADPGSSQFSNDLSHVVLPLLEASACVTMPHMSIEKQPPTENVKYKFVFLLSSEINTKIES